MNSLQMQVEALICALSTHCAPGTPCPRALDIREPGKAQGAYLLLGKTGTEQ